MKKLFLISLLAVIAFLPACNKAGIIGPGVVSVASSSNSYQPTTSGSVWKYVNEVTGKPDELIMVKAVGTTFNINNRVYYTITSASSLNGTTTNYYFTNGVFYTIRGASLVPGATSEFQYLDNSYTVGTKWTVSVNDSGFINGVAGRFEGSTVEKDITKTIGDNTFTNVIHTTVNLEFDYGDGFVTTATYDYYLAKSIGMIEVDSSVAGVVVGKETITSYDVK